MNSTSNLKECGGEFSYSHNPTLVMPWSHPCKKSKASSFKLCLNSSPMKSWDNKCIFLSWGVFFSSCLCILICLLGAMDDSDSMYEWV